MSRTYTIQATIYGGRATTRNMDMATMQSWPDGKRIGCWKVGSTEYWGAVSFYFDLTPVRNKTIESIKLSASCSGTFDYAEEVIYNVKSNASTADWTIPSHNHEVTVPRYGTIPIIDVTSFGLPDHGYVIGGYYRTYAYCNITGGTLTVVTAETAKTITYNGNGGSTPAATTIWGEGSWSGNVTSTVPTRTGYAFNGWNTKADGTGTNYASGASITITANVTLYAKWTAIKSTIDEAPNTEIGSAITVEWTNYGNFTNKIRFVFGSKDTGELSASGQSKSYNIPNSWCDEVPNATSGIATVYLYTYLNGTLLGVDTKTFSAIVPDSVVPSIGTVTATKVNDNPIVNSWDIYLQNFSKVLLQVSGCAAGRGAAIASYKFLGQNINVTNQTANASSSATSGTIEVNGSLVYTVRITDSRGRVAEKTVTISVIAYSLPSIGLVNAIRSNSDGTENAVTGTSIKASAIFTWTQVGSNQLTSSLSYKKHTDANYTQAHSGITSGTDYVIAVGLADIAFSYDVKVEISDTLGNTASFVVTVPPVVGIAFGLKNDRARFGGPVEKAGLQVDWDAEFRGIVDIVRRRCSKTLSGEGWYRVLRINSPSAATSRMIDLFITRSYNQINNEAHHIKLICDYNNHEFVGELSKSNVQIIDKIRYTSDGTYGYVDIHYNSSTGNLTIVDFEVHSTLAIRAGCVAESLDLAPTGETVLATYDFNADGTGDINVNGTVVGQGFADLLFGKGKLIEANSDIDDFVVPGKYTCVNQTTAQTLSHSPYSSAFALFVVYLNDTGSRFTQIAIPNSGTITIKIRTFYSTFTTWKTLTPT